MHPRARAARAAGRRRRAAVFEHDGFWQCADTLRDVELLRGLWDSGNAPWRVWDDRIGAAGPNRGRRSLDRDENRGAARGGLVTPDASIVIPLYNNRRLTELCLDSIAAALGDRLGRSWELVLVDNGSLDDTAELLDAWRERTTQVRSRRTGPSRAP